MIEISNLRKSYGKKLVLDDINMCFSSGKVYGIVGENGAGKTTLFKCISGLEEYSGTISSPYDSLKNHLGYVETNPIFMSYITGWEYLKLLCISKKIKVENFEEQNIFNLPLHEYADSYSTGMKKKLALMGVLLRKNDVFILDEPFNGVDIHSNMMIVELIKKLTILGKTILISSHIFSTLRDTCDEILLLSGGKIAHTYPPSRFHELEDVMKQKIMQDDISRLELE